MKKSDLRTGMVAVSREGIYYVVLESMFGYSGVFVRVNGSGFGWNQFENYREDLSENAFSSLDIMRVYMPKNIGGLEVISGNKFDDYKYDLIYDRIDPSILYDGKANKTNYKVNTVNED